MLDLGPARGFAHVHSPKTIITSHDMYSQKLIIIKI